jgi:mRNA-degrading endonuclease RelE of RelBE toxin-antitoxin system
VTYRVEWKPKAIKEVISLGPRLAEALFAHAERVAENPYRLGGWLQGEFEGCLSAHIAGHRLVYEVDDDVKLVTIIVDGRRAHSYRRGR